MLTIRGLDHLVLRTADVDRMVAFYGEVLGCAVERRVDDLGLVQMRAGAALIDLVDTAGTLGAAGGAPPGTEGRNLDHFCLQVAALDHDDIARRLAPWKITPDAPARRYGAEGFGQSIYFTDPDGNTIELKGPAEET